jgi:hypothetical protein
MYQYNSGFGQGLFTTVYLNLKPDGTGSLTWSIGGRDGKYCYATMDMAQPGMLLPSEVTPTPAPTLAPQTAVTALPINAGRYQVKWTVMDMLCPAAMQPLAPSFTEATLIQKDASTMIVDYGDGQYALSYLAGTHMYTYIDTQAGDMIYTMSLASTTPDKIYLSWGGIPTAQNASSCVVMADLTPLD